MAMPLTTTAINLSNRVNTLRPSATFAVTERVRQLRAQGEDIIGFGAGEPDFDTPQIIKDAAIAALQDGQTHYAPVAGTPGARAAIAAKLQQENNITCTADDIVISVGAKHCLYLVLQCLIDPPTGETEPTEVVLPTPAWVSYRPQIELAGATAVEVAGAIENDFHITPQQLDEAITSRTAAVIINSPSNPCGTMYTPADLRALAEVLEAHPHVVVISDEIYEKLIYTDTPHFSIGSVPAIADRVVTVNGLSKAYAMTGWRIGYACAPGGLARAMAKLQGQMTSCITAFFYNAIIAAIEHAGEDVERMRQTFARRAALIHELISNIPDVRCPQPTGAFYVFPDISAYFNRISPAGNRITSSVSFAEALLDEAKVAVVPGDDFGDCGSRHIRLSFAASEDLIREGVGRIDQWLRSFADQSPGSRT